MTNAIFPASLASLDDLRRRGYEGYLNFYNGDQWRTRPQQRERRLTYNYAQIIVDRGASVLLHDMTMQIDRTPGAAEEEEGKARDALALVARQNGLGTLDLETEIDCAVTGDAVYKVTWDDEAKEVRVTSPDAANVWVWWKADNVAVIERVAQQYTMGRQAVEARFGRVAAVDDTKVTEVWTASTFEVWAGNDLVRTEANPYGFIPFVIMPNIRRPKRFWGVSDIPVIEDVTLELNREMSTLSAIMELSGNPIAVLENVTDTANIAIAPGAVWELPENAKAYLLDLFAGGAVTAHVDYVTMLYRTLHDLAETPRSVFGDSQRTSASGVAVELDMTPLLFKIRRKRLSRELAYVARAKMVLKLLVKYAELPDKDWNVAVQWGDVLPRDRTDEVRREQLRVNSGLSSWTSAMDRLGVVDSAEEFAKILKEQEQMQPLEAGEGESDGGQSEPGDEPRDPTIPGE